MLSKHWDAKCAQCGKLVAVSAMADGTAKPEPFMDIDGGGVNWLCPKCAPTPPAPTPGEGTPFDPIHNTADDLVRRGDVIAFLKRRAAEHADMALTSDPEHARRREAMEAAFTQARHAVAFMPPAQSAPAPSEAQSVMSLSDAQIKYMVERFLHWILPYDFNPDGGISFDPILNEHTDYPTRREPSGTNLFDATQAEAMIRYMIEGMPAPTAPAPTDGE